jgi:thiosulfate/3-mercaptopyruvate sulfurtransferase
VVIYDDSAVKTSARAWFIARMHGVENVAILDGGLTKWRGEGRQLESGPAEAPAGNFTASRGHGTVRFKSDMLVNLGTRREQVLDARGRARFSGEEADFRPNIASGHIPGSCNLPYNLLFQHDGTFCRPANLKRAFELAQIDLDKPIVTTCGGGVTAAVLLFALHLLGKDDVALYDGSWSEWGADPATPKELGAAA